VPAPLSTTLKLYRAKRVALLNELTAMLPFRVDLRATQENDPSYPKLLSGSYKGARRLWARGVHSAEDKSPFRRP
jgi:hypothetical protein